MENLVELSTRPVEFVRVVPYHPFFSISSLITSFIEPWINVLETRNSFDLEYADGSVHLNSFEEAQATLNDLNVAAGRYGLSFAPSKCKVMLTDWTGPITPPTLSDEQLDFVDSFTYLGSCINASGDIADKIASRTSRVRAVYGNLRHLWRRMDISLMTEDRVYKCTVPPTYTDAKHGQYVQKTFIDCKFSIADVWGSFKISVVSTKQPTKRCIEGFSDRLTKQKAWLISPNTLVLNGSVMSSEWTRSA